MEVNALCRVADDARSMLAPGANLSPCEIGVAIWRDEATGARHVASVYRPDLCNPPIPASMRLHRSIGYVLTPARELLGPRIRGR
jgi:hypothetical protein